MSDLLWEHTEIKKRIERDKLELEKGPAAIDAEIERRIPLMKDGGFIVMPDHLITPGTSLVDYKYYLSRIRELRF